MALILRERIMTDNIILNFRIHGNTNDKEIFFKVKKVDMLKPLVKKRLVPLANDIPSTQINLQTMDGMRMEAMTNISKYSTRISMKMKFMF